MTQSPHNRAAELHNSAAHAHAAVAHTKADHLSAYELSKRAHELSMDAHRAAEQRCNEPLIDASLNFQEKECPKPESYPDPTLIYP
jgi:hypothetical protein